MVRLWAALMDVGPPPAPTHARSTTRPIFPPLHPPLPPSFSATVRLSLLLSAFTRWSLSFFSRGKNWKSGILFGLPRILDTVHPLERNEDRAMVSGWSWEVDSNRSGCRCQFDERRKLAVHAGIRERYRISDKGSLEIDPAQLYQLLLFSSSLWVSSLC